MKFLKQLFEIERYEGKWLELFLARVLFVLILFPWEFWGIRSTGFFFDFYYSEQRDPNGLAHWIDFTWIGDPQFAFVYLKTIVLIAGIFYCLGIVCLPAVGTILFIAICVGTLRNSQGNIHHGTQIIALIVLGQFLAYAFEHLKEWRKEKRIHLWKNTLSSHRRAFVYSQQMIAAAYVIAGIAKLVKSDFKLFEWIERLPNMAVFSDRNGFLKTYESGSQAFIEHGEKVTKLVLEHPTLVTSLIAPGLIIELVAFILLFNRKLSFLVGVMVLVMHFMIGYIMQLKFPLNEFAIWIFVINLPFLVSWLILKGWDRVKRQAES